MSDWFTKDRSETDSSRMPDRLTYHNTKVENPALGINVYKGIFDLDFSNRCISTLENNLFGSSKYQWSPAHVTESDIPMYDARNCLDFKIGHKNLGERDRENAQLYDIHQEAFDKIYPASQDYGAYWGVGIQYFETFNFVKYSGAGTHFNIHADHGPAYVCTVSMVGYLNDDYSGGEIYFPRFNLEIKPEAGDLIIFPSTFIYEHASKPIKDGTKYSIVVMTDYNNRGGLRYHQYRLEDNQLVY